MITIGILAIAIAAVSAWVAKGLLLLIALFTNLLFFQRISTEHAAAPACRGHDRARVHGSGPQAIDSD
jgi:hypothetical protein